MRKTDENLPLEKLHLKRSFLKRNDTFRFSVETVDKGKTNSKHE